ncbi:MAG: NAD-dependent epimerase/dehydratase family protein [Myxococcota bacterium]
MRVMVTGGTGFVGSHAVEALVAGGHEVHLLVRNPAKIRVVFEQRGIEIDGHTVGDMADSDAVRSAMTGCDAVLHAAASLYGGNAVRDANVRGVENAVGLASELGLDPILYISTVAAMYPPPGDMIRVDDPIVNLKTTYGESKAEGERYARELQAADKPVVTIYPAGIYGPNDPGMGEPLKGLRDALRFGWPITATGVSIIDVRDLASVVVACLEPNRGPRRFMAGGHFVSWPQFADICDEVTGRHTRRVRLSPLVLRGVARLLDFAKKVVPFEYPLTHEASLMATNFVPCDSSSTIEQLGIAFRPTEETIADAIRWLYEQGEISAKTAGKLTR